MLNIGKRAAFFATAAALGAGMLVPSVGSASAQPSAKTNYVFQAAGSDTIFCLDRKVAGVYNAGQKTKSGNKVANDPPVLKFNLGCETTPAIYKVLRLRRLLGLAATPFAPIPKRKRHWTRYNRIREKILAAEDEMIVGLRRINRDLLRRARLRGMIPK